MPPDGDPVDLYELADVAEIFGHHDKARYAWRQAVRNGYDRVACHLAIARSFAAEGRIADAMRIAPKRGPFKDEQCLALFTLFDFLRTCLRETDRGRIDEHFGTDAGIENLIARLPSDDQTKPAVMMLVSALAIILALRAKADPRVWAKALEWAARANLPSQHVDAILALAAPMHGGEPLRIAAVALGDHRAAAVLAKYHKAFDEKRTHASVRRREDFVVTKK